MNRLLDLFRRIAAWYREWAEEYDAAVSEAHRRLEEDIQGLPPAAQREMRNLVLGDVGSLDSHRYGPF